MAERIIEKSAESMYVQDQAAYSIVTNRRRAIPAVQDGLKPVQRRIMYGAYKKGFRKPSQHGKCQQLTGLVMGELHPHGDCYQSIVAMAAWYKMKYPLMYGYGGFGAVSGSGASAPRYTETALSDFGYDIMIDELAQANNIVDWIDTYTRNDKEPEYLPTKLPNVLINGGTGIGVGMSFNVPSHNIC